MKMRYIRPADIANAYIDVYQQCATGKKISTIHKYVYATNPSPVSRFFLMFFLMFFTRNMKVRNIISRFIIKFIILLSTYTRARINQTNSGRLLYIVASVITAQRPYYDFSYVWRVDNIISCVLRIENQIFFKT